MVITIYAQGKNVRNIFKILAEVLTLDEISNKMGPNRVFKSLDITGELADKLIYVDKHKGDKYYVIFEDGRTDWYTLDKLNVDPESIRKYDYSSDPDFMGARDTRANLNAVIKKSFESKLIYRN